MRYLSVCSGIEAASVAWHSLGWRPAAFSEIALFPRAVLTRHWPAVPLVGDFTTIKGNEYGPIDLLVGGTPCQSFSVAGLRGGLDDERGNLALEFLRLAQRTRPRWLVWENVPGVLSSNSGRDFGAILGGMVELGYGFAYRVLDAQYIRVDGLERAVPQRRRRVFVVGYLGDWRRAAAVLFERESLSGHSAPRRIAGKRVAPTISDRTRGGGGLGTDAELDGPLIATPPLTHKPYGDNSSREGLLVAHSLRGEGFDASEVGSGRGTPLVPICFDTTQITSKENRCNPRSGDPCHPLAAGAHAPAVVQPVADTLTAYWERSKGAKAGNQVGLLNPIIQGWAVRRLTPLECERLQGFPDGWTDVPYRGKPAADGPRYKALGNSMAVNCMRWIGQRIDQVERSVVPMLEAAE